MSLTVEQRKVLQSMRTQLLTLPFVFDSIISVENRSFRTPPPDVNKPKAWFRETLIPVSEQLTANQQVEATGIYQIDVMVPDGTGTELVSDNARDIAKAFGPAISLNFQGISVSIFRVERGQGNPDPDGVWFFIPVRINWRTFAFETAS